MKFYIGLISFFTFDAVAMAVAVAVACNFSVPRNCAELLSAGLYRHHHDRTPDCPSPPKLQVASKLQLGDCNTTYTTHSGSPASKLF